MAGHKNRAANVAAWQQMRAEQAAEAEARRERRRAEKQARREANRAAWWSSRGLSIPDARKTTESIEPTSGELNVKRCSVDQASATEWHVVTTDGLGYEVESKGFDVTIDGESYTVPSLEAAGELIELAEQTRREQADEAASFEPGMRLERGSVAYEVEHATSTGVTIRIEAAGCEKRQTLKVRRCERGQYVKLHAGSRAERVIYAADLAA